MRTEERMDGPKGMMGHVFLVFFLLYVSANMQNAAMSFYPSIYVRSANHSLGRDEFSKLSGNYVIVSQKCPTPSGNR